MKIELNDAKIKSIITTIKAAIVEAVSKNQISTTWVFEDVQGQVFISFNPAMLHSWAGRYTVVITMFGVPLTTTLFAINDTDVQGVVLGPTFERLKGIATRSNANFEIYKKLIANALCERQNLMTWTDSIPDGEVKLDSHDFSETMKLIMLTEFKEKNIVHTQTLVIDNEVAFTATVTLDKQCKLSAAVNPLAAIIIPMIQQKLGHEPSDKFIIETNKLGLMSQLLQLQSQHGMVPPGFVTNQMVMNNDPFGPGAQYNPPFNNMNGFGPNF